MQQKPFIGLKNKKARMNHGGKKNNTRRKTAASGKWSAFQTNPN